MKAILLAGRGRGALATVNPASGGLVPQGLVRYIVGVGLGCPISDAIANSDAIVNLQEQDRERETRATFRTFVNDKAGSRASRRDELKHKSNHALRGRARR